MGKREETEGTNLFVCEGPHSEELLPGQDELYAVLAFIDHPIETEATEKGLFLSKSLGRTLATATT